MSVNDFSPTISSKIGSAFLRGCHARPQTLRFRGFPGLHSKRHASRAQQFDPRERFEVPDRVRLSEHVLWSLMKNQVLPSYPAEARNKGIQGEVVLILYVEKDGRVSNVGVVSGDPLLTA
jgi:hypothetical protein